MVFYGFFWLGNVLVTFGNFGNLFGNMSFILKLRAFKIENSGDFFEVEI